MGVDFTTIYPSDGGEPWEASCDHCGEDMDLDHYGDMEEHTWAHRAAEEAEMAQAARGGPKHRKDGVAI